MFEKDTLRKDHFLCQRKLECNLDPLVGAYFISFLEEFLLFS